MLLPILHDRIAARCRSIVESHPEWPCREGCDTCCRNLAQIPLITEAEWRLIEPVLPKRVRERAQTRSEVRPIVCPLLEDGACLVYEQRPIACRTYGFYVDREAGLYCREIAARVEAGELGDVIWGNQEAVDAELDQAGPRRPLTDYIRGA